MIELRSVKKSFGDSVVLDGIDLSIAEGEICGLIGVSGAGKSTLLRCLNRLEEIDEGQVIVDGTDIATLSKKELIAFRRQVGMVFQQFSLMERRTVYENVFLPLRFAHSRRSQVDSRIREILDLVGLGDKLDQVPRQLSGGQKQRVGIARALATQPKVLLSDEATSALDPETTRSILDLLATINRELGLTILLITHEMAVIRAIAQRVAVLDAGRIVEQGDVFDLFTRPQHETTRSFLAAESGRELPAFVASQIRPEPVPGGQVVVRIVFRGPFATHPVLSQLARELGIDVNILGGAVDSIAGRPFGTLIVGLPNNGSSLDKALAFLKARDLDTEVLGHVA